MIPVILSGGSGTRLWPLSRKQKPKQFIPLIDDNSLFENTVMRLNGITELAAPIVVCNEDHRFMVAEELVGLGISGSSILLEPVGRNTAPAIAVAAMHAAKSNPQELLLVLPADHQIKDTQAFHAAIEIAKEAAMKGGLLTFGIKPTSPHTGYGYIKCDDSPGSVLSVEEFVEKPDADKAQEYLESEQYYWNSGMFMFRADRYLEELAKSYPDMIEACQKALNDAKEDLDFIRLDKQAFEASPSDSIDYAVMEKTHNAQLVPLDAGWSDVGSWSSLWDVSVQDENANVLRGDVLLSNVKDSYVHSEGRLVSVIGLDHVIVIETDDAVMVADKDHTQDVKEIVEQLKSADRQEMNNHRKVYRPWGYYDSLDVGERFQVKRIVVKPGEKLSVQMHHHRAEHWIVVAGTAKVTRGEETFLVSENQSTYIPIGTVHALENPGTIPLEMIEVQSGSYLGEDDIVRFEDRYGRTE
jgi:mannose-1-phosphate guanylyltransferase/mannose-6-phosphate isomerase